MKRKRLREIIKVIEEEVTILGGWSTIRSREYQQAIKELRALSEPPPKLPSMEDRHRTIARHEHLK